jgi:lipoic acid synthetase
MRGKKLHTVCEQAVCPNLAECWRRGAATFLILGETCTRNCAFCAVKSAKPPFEPPDPGEPGRLAEAAAAMGLSHVVITSVTRDDLEDGGALVFAEAVRQVRGRLPGCAVEVLIPDFRGARAALATVLDAGPEILGHNLETVARLYGVARPGADYGRSLGLLRLAKELSPSTLTKSGLMVGLGEAWGELLEAMSDLRASGCDILTLGQYLRPSKAHLPVARYYTPEEFVLLKDAALRLGFRWVESGPLVRSSYHADEQVRESRAVTRTPPG